MQMKWLLSLKRLAAAIITIGLVSNVCAQSSIKGHVYSAADRQPIAGAAIIETNNPANGTTTNANGEFTLVANYGTTVTISCLGYKRQTVKISGSNTFFLEEEINELEELVVTGYTAEKRADIIGSVSVVKMSDIKDIPTGNVMTALQGRIPGMQISTNGAPGGVGYSVQIRGITTINDSSPLYVIDGVQTRGHLSTILNANDIESIQVLKDAASSAIYGSKASNGVIIITTKRGQKDRVTVEFSAQLSAQTIANRLNMLNARQWGEVYWQASKNDGITPSHPVYGSGDVPVIPEFIDSSNNQRASDTDWQDEGYGTGFMQNYNISVSKGTERGSSSLGINYIDDKGMLKYTEFKRINIKLNSDYNFLNNRLRIGENLNLSRYTESLAPSGIHELLISQHPLIPVHTEDGNWGGYVSSLSDMNNPIRMMEESRDNTSGNWRALGNLFIEVEPLKNLILRSSLSIDYRNGFSRAFTPKWKEGTRENAQNSLDINNNYEYEWIWSNTVTYDIKLKDHSISLLAGLEAKSYRTEYLTGKRTDFLIQTPEYLYLNAGAGTQTNTNGASEYAMFSQFGKISYNYKEKYLFSSTLRRDASSRFGSQNNAGLFPSVSAGWRISRENFMSGLKFLSDLKLRASWGKNGNDLVDNEATYSKFYLNNDNASYDIIGSDNSVSSGVIKTRSANNMLQWEVTTQTNIGIDAALFDNRLMISFDWWNKNTDDMLIDRPYIGVIGEGGTYSYNGASLNNKGFEGIITWRDRIRDFRYEVTFNFSRFRNEITSLPEDIYYTWGGGNGVDKSIVGQPYGSWFGYRTDGLFRTTEELDNGVEQPGKGLGRIRYVDLYADNMINDKDREWLGSANPKFSGGLNVAMAYKQFDLSFFLSGMIRDVWNNSKFYTDFFQLWPGNHGTNLLKAWNETTNFDSDIPALTLQDLNNEGRVSNYFIENGSFLRMKSLQIGYTLPQHLAKKIAMNSARIYFQVQNVFTITNYSGVDPEVLGYDYPLPRTFTLGINIGF